MNDMEIPEGDAHTCEEFAAFLSFASVASLSVSELKKMGSPSPDLRAIVDGEVWAVELTRAVDPEVMERQAKMMVTHTMIRDFVEKDLSPGDKDKLLGASGSLSIAINFDEESSTRARAEEIPKAIEHLVSLAPNLPAETSIPGCPSIDVVRVYSAPDTAHRNLVVFTGSSGNVRVPLAERMLTKLNKPYEPGDAAQTHLVLYAWINLLLPPDTWSEEIDDLLDDSLPDSAFDVVWVADLNAETVLYRYPHV